MITSHELLDKAREFGLTANIVEKDLFDQWVFKGGTCLKKCYFRKYRFSEDLDYTLRNYQHINEDFLTNTFKDISQWMHEESGIEIPENTIQFKMYQNKNKKNSIEGKMGYIGPLQRQGDPVRIKFDLTADELLVLPPVTRDVHHPYSDMPDTKAICYGYQEIFAEKIRALSKRARPRDLYDVIHLYRSSPPELKSQDVFNVLKKKCAYKKLPVPTMERMKNHRKYEELAISWENMLAHQLSDLPPLNLYWQELPDLFSWLYQKQPSSEVQQS